MLTEIAERGIRPTPKQSAAIRTPVGLDLGSNSPETIALSIIAEIQASAAQRDARPLSQRAGPIHGIAEVVQGARGACSVRANVHYERNEVDRGHRAGCW